METHAVKLLITFFLQCEALNWLPQPNYKPMETYNNPIGVSKHVVLPSVVSDLPRARDILPGHTLIRPDMDSLRSAIRYPNKELQDGARVYGNGKFIGISVGDNERILNTGFRRSRDYYDGGDEEPWSNNREVDRDTSDEKYLNFKSNIVLDQSPNSYSHKPPKPPKTSKSIFIIGAMATEESENYLRSLNNNNKGKNLVPVHSNYIILLADNKTPKTQRDVLSDILNKQTSLKNKKVLRAGKFELKPVPVSIDPESVELEKERYVPPQRLLDYLNSRNEFDHVTIKDRAPTIQQLVPASSKKEDQNIRKWWFFNQDDYKPFL